MNQREQQSMVAISRALQSINQHKYVIATRYNGELPEDVLEVIKLLKDAQSLYKEEIRQNIEDTVALSETNHRFDKNIPSILKRSY